MYEELVEQVNSENNQEDKVYKVKVVNKDFKPKNNHSSWKLKK